MESTLANRSHNVNLPRLTGEEFCRQLAEWNNTAAEYPSDACVHHLFEAQAERRPDKIAVVFDGEQMTYGELNRRSNQLAHRLRSLGVGPEVLVGICVERSVEMLIGLLGILKAGGAYVPLDPSYPQERLSFMLSDASVRVLLTQDRLVKTLPRHGAVVIRLDADWEFISGESVENPDGRTTVDSLAYVIYTSGSTGQPKGVEIPHRGILRLLFGVDYVELSSAETFLQMAPISFDASTFEIWGALLHGARCALFPGSVPTFEELGHALRKNGVSTLWLTASLFNAVIDEAPEVLSGVKQLLIGGEALSVSHVRRALRLFPSQQIINGYGPTESTTFTCCYRIPQQLAEDARSIPIGPPIANTQVYILDERLRPVPSGEPGELYIGGAGLARGYLKRPELTAERFIQNPFSDDPRARLYKTGDLARHLPGGTVEFIGRIDQQVKIRGFRVELGEIEAVLGAHPRVREVAVVAREDAPGDKRLTAYVVPDRSEPSPAGELRGHLKERLPEYMVPAAFVILEKMPLNPNGKLDRRALPMPVRETTSGAERSFTGPRNEMERVIAKVWQEVMHVEKIGVDDNFFDLGAHSLHIVQALNKLKVNLNIDLSITKMFQYPTVGSLAEHLSRGADERPASGKIQDRAQRQREALARQKQLVRGKGR